jgi:hypothetical protein
MKSKPKASNEGPLRVDRPFDDAIARVLQVKPPARGWATYEARLRRETAKKRTKAKLTNKPT